MASIIYQASAPPWKTGRQSIQTFPSGLMRVDQEYVVPTATKSDYMSTFAANSELTGLDTPAIDGIYVYPDPQWADNGNGTTSTLVSAYGRTRTGMQDQFLTQTTIQKPTISFSVWNLTGTICIPSNTVINIEDFETEPDLFFPFNFRRASNPDLRELSVTELRRINDIIWAGENFSFHSYLNATIKTRVVYQVILTTDGETASESLTVWAELPQIRISSAKNYGQFTELNLTTIREGDLSISA